ncbi:MAG: Eco57I restriction-modification methylase domain-containing protein, partial [Desulfovibrio sp.]|nr:Eco57I restriction-modification methylase domain-containing protein [Desulfovibrio sp.]
MKFDCVIGNPPYQDDRIGESATARPVYHLFMDAAYEIADAVLLITPARFLFDNGLTPREWNQKILADPRFKVLSYERDASKYFPLAEIKGGVAITYRDRNKTFAPVKIFAPRREMTGILKKVWHSAPVASMADLGYVATKFNTDALFADYPELKGRERRMSSNVFKYSFFRDEKATASDIMIYGVIRNKRHDKYIAKKYVDAADVNIGRYKIVMPKADGDGEFGAIVTNPEILPPGSGFTHTFLGVGSFDSLPEARACLKYLKTKFARALLSVLKVTQNLNAEKLKY